MMPLGFWRRSRRLPVLGRIRHLSLRWIGLSILGRVRRLALRRMGITGLSRLLTTVRRTILILVIRVLGILSIIRIGILAIWTLRLRWIRLSTVGRIGRHLPLGRDGLLPLRRMGIACSSRLLTTVRRLSC